MIYNIYSKILEEMKTHQQSFRNSGYKSSITFSTWSINSTPKKENVNLL